MHQIPNPMAESQQRLTKSCLLVLNRNIFASSALVLSTKEIRDLLILSLFNRRLVILCALSEEFLLDKINAYSKLTISYSTMRGGIVG